MLLYVLRLLIYNVFWKRSVKKGICQIEIKQLGFCRFSQIVPSDILLTYWIFPYGTAIQYQCIQSQRFGNFYCYLLTIFCKYKQLLYILLSKRTNISKMTSDLLASNQQFGSNQTRGVGTKCVGTKCVDTECVDIKQLHRIFQQKASINRLDMNEIKENHHTV